MKVIVFKLGAMGDAIMASSVLDAIRRVDPEAKITWVGGKSIASLLSIFHEIDETIWVDDARLLKGGVWGALTELIALWKRLFLKKYDLILVGHSDVRYGLLTLFCRTSVRRSFGVVGGRRWPVPGRYHADEYARLVTGEDGPLMHPSVLPSAQLVLNKELAGLKDPGKKAVALAPGGARNMVRDDVLRRWPLESYVEVARKMIDEGYQVFITGGSTDAWVRAAFVDLPVVDVIGKTDIPQLCALYGNVDLVITHDSGPLHLAVLGSASLIALFGPTMPDEKLPMNAKVHVLWGGEKLPCRPCYDGKNYAICGKNECLYSVTVDQVMNLARRILG